MNNQPSTLEIAPPLTIDQVAEELKALNVIKKYFDIVCSAFILKNDNQISTRATTEKVRKLRIENGFNDHEDNILGRIDQDCRYFPYDVFYDGIQDFANAVRNNQLIKDYERSLSKDPSNKNKIDEVVKLLKQYVFIETEDEVEVNAENQKLYELKNAFLREWPIDRIASMRLNEYTNLDKTSFCYWLEHITRDLGSIAGGSSYKFGIYKTYGEANVDENSNRATDGDYAWFKKYGETRDDAFLTVRGLVERIARSTQDDKLESIDDIDLGHAFKWKIAFLYGDFNCLNMFKLDALRVIASNLNIDYTNKTPVSKFHRAILKSKPNSEEYFAYCHDLWAQYQGRLRDVKDEFAKWLNKNTYDSYRAYLGNSVKEIVSRLDEINNFFEDIDLFLVDPNNVNGLVDTILFMMTKKERLKNQDFVEYDKKNSNGIPKAILGKNNYLRFLKEKFDGVAIPDSDYNQLIKKLDQDKLGLYLDVLRTFVEENNLSPQDERLAYNIRPERNMLAFIIGSRYAFLIHLQNKQTWFQFISKNRFDENSEVFNDQLGNEEMYLNKIDSLIGFMDELREGLKIELDRNYKSPFRRHLNTDFGRDIFQMEISTLNNEYHMGAQIHSKNLIFYGPPGTGKTYGTKEEAVRLANPNFIFETTWDEKTKREHVVNEYDNLRKSGQIVFTTFHQSVSYEDFVEGIKPETTKEGSVVYKVEDGIFKNIVKDALSEYLEVNNEDRDDFETLYDDFVESITPLIGKREAVFTTKIGVGLMLEDVNEKGIWVKYLWSNNKQESEGQHVFLVPKDKLKRVLLEEIVPQEVKSLKSELHPLVGHIHCELFGVYKRFYEFVLNNRGEIETVQFTAKDLEFDDIIDQINELPQRELRDKQVRNYVLIIDEINRGNVSAIFGELITLLEKDKRITEEEKVWIKLPYSKKEFGVPGNLSIIGTMNTADRSVEALDTALRRRFEFKEMMPDYAVIKDKKVDEVLLSDVLRTINQRIELLIDRDHTIGHSYFYKVKTKRDLANAFNNKIVPLLQEYFYGDYGKIGLVLGMGFVEKLKNDTIEFAKFDYDNANDFKISSYVLKQVNEGNVMEAVTQLLGIKEPVSI
ncbi:McrB family protein [Mangrovimonas sp. TPBH4]|uniref:McrB family protein n=1 Tax=Mangrovimonas sp. TPBH4 TaxID=1645914 RepID=UPI0006B58C95|nr:AAA family ATPase [Mangrovimonas sp. TPBH4]